MYPVLVKFGSFTVYTYGVMVAAGFAICAALIYRRAEAFGINKDKAVDLAILMLISGVAGARLLYILLNLSFYLANPVEMIMLSKGGLVWYGGFLAALAVMAAYVAFNKLKFWSILDLFAPYIALGQAFGRIGCFFNGCCYGIKVDPEFSFAVTLPLEGASRLPVQLISAVALFLIFLIVLAWQRRSRFAGEAFLGYCLLYSLKRFGMEFFRGDNPKIFLGLTISQVMSAAIFAAALAIFILKRRSCKTKPTILK